MRHRTSIVASALFAWCAWTAQASPGALDASFGTGGKVTTLIGGALYDSTGTAMALQPDGRIVVAGSRKDLNPIGFGAARYNANGSLDATFGSGGTVVVPVSGIPAAVALQADGKIVIAGAGCAVARLNADGTLDTGFGSGGVAHPGCTGAYGVAVDALGRIVLAADNNDSTYRFVLVRLTASGNPDASFNSTGSVVVSSSFGGTITGARAVAIAPTGKIVALGWRYVGNLGLNIGSIIVARVNEDGTLDTTFGASSNGVVSTTVSPSSPGPPLHGPVDYGYGLALQPTGEIVVAGSASDGTAASTLLVVRYTAAGALDTTFNGTGFATRAVGAAAAAASGVAVQSNGKIVAAGTSWNGSNYQFATVRYLANGAPDNGFGTSGLSNVGFSGDATANAVAIEASGDILVAGGATVGIPSVALIALEGDPATAPPQTSFTSIPDLVNGPSGSFAFNATDASGTGIAGFECSLDGATFTACTSPSAFSGLSDGAHVFRVRARDNTGNYDSTPVSFTWTVTALASTPRLVNISTRGQVQTGFDVMIGGFVISGSTTKTVGVRAMGPNLANYGIPGALANPQVQLVRSSDQTVVASNDDWQTAANAAQLVANWLAPTNPLESTILVNLAPGAYTAIVTGVSNGTGVGLVEVYEVDHPETSLINISTRGKVLTGFDVMIGGFVIQGSGPQTVVVRAIGPSLANYGVAGALANPTLTLVRSGDQVIIATNDDWGNAANAAQLQASGFAPSNPLESAIYVTLAPGAYTAIVSGVNNGTGVGLVEVYKVGP
jgi:uncharacterized delta-60 repeat protein